MHALLLSRDEFRIIEEQQTTQQEQAMIDDLTVINGQRLRALGGKNNSVSNTDYVIMHDEIASLKKSWAKIVESKSRKDYMVNIIRCFQSLKSDVLQSKQQLNFKDL